jgi:sulfonate transport system ATP-binding protein
MGHAMSARLELAVEDKRHGARAVLRGLRLALAPGEIVSLIGASGCGKSTLLSIAAGLDTQFRGSVRLDGRVLDGPDAGIGLVFQEPRLFPWLRVARNVVFGAVPHEDHGRAAALLEEVGLQGHADALPKQLSGGQAQRAAIARGLYGEPRVLLLDEPFSAVDAFTRMRLQDMLVRVARQRALTVLLVTHDIDEALYLSDRVILMDGAPGPARAEFDVTAPWPRERTAMAVSPLKPAILDSLHAAHAI